MTHGNPETPMSDLASDPASTTPAEPLSALYRRPHDLPAVSPFLLEVDRLGAFLRLGKWELYAHTERASECWTLREPGSWAGAAGRLRLTVSWAVPERLTA
jgi:hypothetical protein